ncbi:P-loop containing nucleoside triphosphate hydrolase protein [Xylaria sp. FL1042]|nr:P-loop containing nucleoside triphosphate hydrolase protein [Xylaria sp. FL1042]
MRMVLKSVSDLIDKFLKYPPRRRALVRLDHLIICLTKAVLSFSELEKCINPWVERPQKSLWQRWKLMSQDERITRLNTRLQENKVSLNLVLNIFQCESDIDAQEYQLTLHEMMEKIIDENAIPFTLGQTTLTENKEIRARIDKLGPISAHSTTAAFARPASSSGSISTVRADGGDYDRPPSIRELECVRSSMTTHPSLLSSASCPGPVSPIVGPPGSLSEPSIHLHFENELAQSWVYTRVRRTKGNISSIISQPTSGVWSMLSSLSLDQISNISVIALPITLQDVTNSSWYKSCASPKLDLPDLSKPEVPRDTLILNVAVLGECEVGKSTLINMLSFGHLEYVEKYSTLGGDYYASIRVDHTENRLRITDTPGIGLSEYRIVVNHAIERADAFVLVYSMTDRNSFFQIQVLHDVIMRTKQMLRQKQPPVVIVANKADLEKPNAIPPELTISLTQNLNCALFECSAEHGDNISRPFKELVRCMLGSSSSAIEDGLGTGY